MWRQLLRDSETSVPGPRGKKGSEKGGEEGREGGKGEGGEDLTEAANPSSLSTKLSFWKKRSDSVNFLLSIGVKEGDHSGAARGPQDGETTEDAALGSRSHGGGEAGGGD